MKKYIFTVLFFMLALTTKAQAPYEQYSNDGLSLDFKKIENLDFRVYLMYHLQQDGQFSYVQDTENGVFIITSNNENSDFGDIFDTYYNNKFTDFSMLSKNEIDEQIRVWKSSIASTDMTFIMMDWFLLQSRVDNDHCASSLPFCTSETITFEAANTDNTANEPGMDDGCIGSSYNPSFYHMKIRVGGQFIIHMEGHDPNNNADRDIDFCMWGPYTEEEVMNHTACSHLSSGKIIDCCYSAEETEDCFLGYNEYEHQHNTGHGTINYHMPEVEEYYILMITNFSRQPCVINFSKVPGSGPGETDCGILPGIVTNDGPYCDGETIQLDVNEQPNGIYQWVGPDGWTSTLPHPTRENATVEMSGTYTCTTTVGTETTTASTEVIVSAIPAPIASAQPSSVNYGATTQLNVNPGTQGDFVYHWEPEDMVTDPNAQNPQTVALTSTLTFTVTVTSIIAGCNDTAEVTVAVGSGLTATATADEYTLCENNSTTLHVNPVNGTGNYSYTWEPAEFLNNPNIQNPVATPEVGTTTFTCHVDDGMVTRDATVTIHVNPNQVEERYISICQNSSYHFFDHGDLSTPGIYEAHISTSLGCDSLIRLHLDVNPTIEYNFTVEENESCDSYYWNPEGKPFEGDQTLEFTQSGSYIRTYKTITDCDSVVTMNVQFEYTPNPSEIMPEDTVTSHWVVPATEFQVNTYTFRIYEHNINCHWDSIVWSCVDRYGESVWPIETYIDEVNYSHKMYFCDLIVLDRIEDTVFLTATAYNRCEPVGVSQRFWVVNSFYDIDEYTTAADFSVVPNPNNGDMRLNLTGLSGKVNVKVYDMNGSLIDNFGTYGEVEHSSINYTLQSHAPGIYYFVVTAKEGTIAKKVVVTQ